MPFASRRVMHTEKIGSSGSLVTLVNWTREDASRSLFAQAPVSSPVRAQASTGSARHMEDGIGVLVFPLQNLDGSRCGHDE